MAERRWRTGAVLALLPLCSCSVSCLTYREVLIELDSIERVEKVGDEQRVVYLDEAGVFPWYSRVTLLWPLKPVLNLFWGEPSRSKIERPANQARQLVSVLGDKAGSDLLRCAETSLRVVPIAQSDPSALGRVTALCSLAAIADNLDLDLCAGLADGSGWPVSQPQEVSWIATFHEYLPSARGAEPLTDQVREPYVAALRGLTQRPLTRTLIKDQRLALVSELLGAARIEPDDALLRATQAALLAALRYEVQWTVVDAMQSTEKRWAEVRLSALHILHRQGGPDVVPLLLALMVLPPEEYRATGQRFDDDPYVRLTLVHLCGQLDEARARQKVRLPGRAEWEAVAPIEFLAEQSLNEQVKWASVAQEALSRCLGRPIGQDVDWVRDWYTKYLESAGRK